MSLPTSSIEAFFRWRKERLPLPTFLGLALVVCLCADCATPALASSLLMTFVWLAAFRLLDDVFSRPDDAVHHPGRAVVRGPARLYVRAAVAALVVGFVVAVFSGAAIFYAGLCLFLFVVGVLPTSVLPLRLRALLVLLKYPAMAIALSMSTSTPTPALWRLGLLFFCVFVDEALTGRLPMPARAVPFVGAGLAFFFL